MNESYAAIVDFMFSRERFLEAVLETLLKVLLFMGYLLVCLVWL